MNQNKTYHIAQARHYEACAAILAQAKSKIILPSNHCKGSHAKTFDDKTVAVRSAYAVKFDMMGAIHFAMNGRNDKILATITDNLKLTILNFFPTTYPLQINQWHDSVAHCDVISVLHETLKAMRNKTERHNDYAANS